MKQLWTVWGATTIATLLIAVASARAAPPTPISACGYTIATTGNYIVTRDLTTTTSTPCISFAGQINNVTLDLQGHTIAGNGTGYGIVCLLDNVTACTNIVIVNGTVSKFSDGIHIERASSNTIRGITVQGNTNNGIITFVPPSAIQNLIIDSFAPEMAKPALSATTLLLTAERIITVKG